MKTIIGSNLAKVTLALALATGGTALYAQDTSAPPPPPETGAPAPGDPTLPPPSEPTDPAPAPAPAPAPGEHVDADGDGIDDVTGAPIPQDHGDTLPDPQ